MLDSLLYDFNEAMVNDTSIDSISVIDSSLLEKSLPIKFVQSGNVHIEPAPLLGNLSYDLIIYSLLFLMGIISMIWYFLPDRFLAIFTLKTESQFNRLGESNIAVPGNLITGFFWLNFISSAAIFVLLTLNKLFENYIVGVSYYEILSNIFLVIAALLFYRIVLIYGAAIVFQTKKMMKQQVIIGRNILFITGVFLVPVSLFIIFTDSNLFIYAALIIITLLQVYRLVLIVVIGKSSTIFSALHIILYLCALEIVPVLVLIRLVGNGSGI